MKEYKLSVVVLVYNTEEYLRECFDSLVNQTLKGIEIIIVNDESPDNSSVIIEEYQRKYRNIKVINQKNSGGAIAGNNGVRNASGDYVAIMDSDDILPLDAYEKMYSKAISENADIIIGKANVVIDNVVREILYNKEKDVWKKDRVITDLKQFLDIFYDAFYWNKIFKREFLLNNDCLMPPGMLYADRPMVHKAYLYANKIAIITEVVYLWRKRGENATHKSASQVNTSIKNFIDRMDSYKYQYDYFEKFGDKYIFNEFLKRNIERLLFPIRGILESEDFKETYLYEVREYLKKIKDPYNNELGILKNLYCYMILNKLTEELVFYLETKPKGKIIEEAGKYFWALPYFRNEETNIPDQLFEIDVLLTQFVHLEDIYLDKENLFVKKIDTPMAFDVKDVKLVLQSRNNIDDYHEYSPVVNTDDGISIKANITSLNFTNTYDLYLHFMYDDKETRLRITKDMIANFKGMKSNHENFHLYNTKKNYISMLSKNIEIQAYNIGPKKIDVRVNPNVNEEPLSIQVKDRATKEVFTFNKVDNEYYELMWKHFLDPNRTYDFYYRVNGRRFRISLNGIKRFESKDLKHGSIYVSLYKTQKGNLSLQTFGGIRSKVKKMRSMIKS